MSTRSEWIVGRTEAQSRGGMVAAKTPWAAEAGAAVLAKGGNAVDAAVTTSFVAGVVERAAVGVRVVGAAGAVVDEGLRDRREDVVAGCGEVVVDRVAVRVGRHRAVAANGADADHVRQGRGIVREAPRRRGRLRPVSDRGDDHDALRVGVFDRGLLERRIRVELRVERVTDAAEARG